MESFHKDWGSFFGGYNKNLILGKKISGGTEGEILEATWRCDDGCHYDVVMKVFNTEYLRILSLGLLKKMAKSEFDSFAFHSSALIYKATLLRDGQFELVLRRYSRDLDKLIQLRMKSRILDNQGLPFLDHEAKHLMQEIAKGMNILHTSNILHRGLKPSNVLTLEPAHGGPIWCYVADFECDEVIGAEFYRSPEVVRRLTERDSRENAVAGITESYRKPPDVYSFAMTCYKISTGLVPFTDVNSMYDIVLAEERRPDIPDYIDHRVRDLTRRCWHQEPSRRPTFGEIVVELDHIIRS